MRDDANFHFVAVVPSSTHVVRSMISESKQQSVVGKNGKIEIQAPDLPEGTVVEVIVLVESQATDETDYLLATSANRDRLLQALERAKDFDNLIVMTPDGWRERKGVGACSGIRQSEQD
jgi:antitoxin YefM